MLKLKIINKNTAYRYMLSLGYNLTDLSNEIGITRQYLSAILNGNRNPSPALAKNIAYALNVEINDIFFASDGNKLFTNKHTKISEV